MIQTILFIVTFMSATTHVVSIISLVIFGRKISFPNINGFNLGSCIFSYPSLGYQIYWWFNFAGINI